ncbi:hypothetical protein KIPE111705_40405 [Kibdelosporangium persicum]
MSLAELLRHPLFRQSVARASSRKVTGSCGHAGEIGESVPEAFSEPVAGEGWPYS